MKKKALIAIAIIFGVLIVDQILKIWVKTTMEMGQEIHIIGDRVMLHLPRIQVWLLGWNWEDRGVNLL
jgi:lipoprotein signal peptidase